MPDIVSQSQPAEGRRRPRKSVAAEVQLRRSGELNYVVNAYDLSDRGCKVEFVERPRLRETVWIRFGGLASIESKVRWIGDLAMGLEFRSPMHQRVLELLLERLRQAEVSP